MQLLKRLTGIIWITAGLGTLIAQTLSKPLAAVLIDGNGELVALHGMSGNLLPPSLLWQGSASGSAFGASFNGTSGAVKVGAQILTLDSNGSVKSIFRAPDGPALFSFQPDGTLGWIYFENYALFRSAASDSSFSVEGLPGAIVALGPSAPNQLAALAESNGQLWSEQITNAGALVSQTPVSGSAPAVWFEGGWLVAGDSGLLWHAPGNAQPQKISTSEPVHILQAAGQHYASVNAHWLLNAKLQLTEIPKRQSIVHRRTAQQ